MEKWREEIYRALLRTAQDKHKRMIDRWGISHYQTLLVENEVKRLREKLSYDFVGRRPSFME